MRNPPPKKYRRQEIQKEKPIRSQKLKNITQSHINVVHNAVIDGKYELALSKMKSIHNKSIPAEFDFHVEKLRYELKRSVCDWDDNLEEETVEIMKRTMHEIERRPQKRVAVDPFFALCLPFTQLQLKKLNQSHVLHKPERGQLHRRKVRRDNGIIKIGYMSSDFHHHSLSHLVCSIPRYHDTTKFEVYVIHLRIQDDFIPEDHFYRDRVNTGVAKVIDLSEILDDGEAVKLLMSYDLDILVDYNGTTSSYRHGILAKKPAKIQVMSLIGFCGTSGNPAIDYIVLDQIVAPLPTVQQHFTEKGAFLPFCYMTSDYASLFPYLKYKETLTTKQHGPIIVNAFKEFPSWIKGSRCINRIEEMLKNDKEMFTYYGYSIYNSILPEDWRSQTHARKIMVVTCRKYFNIPNHSIVFSNFNHPWKLDPNTFKGWMQILRRVKDSVLWQMGENKTVEKNLRRFAKENGVAPNRIIFYPVQEKEVHLQRIQLSDIALDTAIFNGHTTSMDAIWAGIPVITVPGYTAQGRVATSILKTMGLDQLIAETQEKAVEIGVDLGNNRNKLSDLKKVIHEKKSSSPLFNVPEYVKNLEELYSEMMKRYKQGKNPDHIILSDLAHKQVPIMSKFVCYFCSKQFLNVPQLESHLRLHTLENPCMKSLVKSN